VTALPDFRIEAYFSRWEFTARHNLTASDVQSIPMADLVALADDEDRKSWETLTLGYTETYGDPLLRQAIAGMYSTVDSADVLCFSGAEEGVYLALQILLEPGDHAVIVTPSYQSAETVPLSRAEVTGVPLDPANDWALDVDAVLAAIRPTTRVVYVNFPNNPTGKVIDKADFERLVRGCDERGVRVFSDEVYRGLERDPARTLPPAVDLSDRALSLNVTSKSLGLPGLRLGWIACHDRKLLSRLERAKHYTTICNAAPSEVLARIAIKARETLLQRNRGIITDNLAQFGAFFAEFPELFQWAPPDGGSVIFPRYLGADGVEAFCRALVEEASVLLLPASIFASDLNPMPADRFRIGLGRTDSAAGLETFRSWLRNR
jgi:aspartate/methionine/tyrosine aminotransferase